MKVEAPTDLVAHASRGGLLIFDLDEDGERKIQAVKGAEPIAKAPTRKRRSSRRGRAPTALPSTGMAMTTGTEKKVDPKDAENQRQKKLEGIVGADEKDANDSKSTDSDEKTEEVEVVKGFRWIAVTGLFDNKKLREAYAKAQNLDFASAHPNYLRLDLQRQQLSTDGGDWSEWANVAREDNLEVLNNVPEIEEEMTVEESRLPALVDHLPFLKWGNYRGVHLAAFLTDASKKAIAAPKPAAKPAAGFAGGTSSPASMPMMSMPPPSRLPSTSSSSSMPSSMSSMYNMSGSAGGAGGTNAEAANYPKSDLPKLMVRSLDFTVDAEATYRYRARVVIANPNHDREDIAPGVDASKKEIEGDWSEPTDLVSVPPDVATYAINKTISGTGGMGSDDVRFQVATWDPSDGQTLVKAFDVGPGMVIGDEAQVKVPDADGKKVTQAKKNFTSRQVVLDTEGGTRSLEQLGVPGPGFDVPALAVVLRPDGTMAIRSESRDKRDPSMNEMLNDYTKAIKDVESGKPKKKKRRAGMPGMTGMPAGRR